MRIFLTGAHGFTGSRFIEKARERGHEVFVSEADILDLHALNQEVATVEPDSAVHLAAISYVAHQDISDLYKVNVIGTDNLLAALATKSDKIQKIIVASSAQIYGARAQSPINENAKLSPASHYAISKLACENICHTYADKFPIIIARPFNYTGVGQDIKFLVPKIVDHFVKGEKQISLGNIHVRREFNDVDFVCETYLDLITSSTENIEVNICTGRSYSVQTIFDILTAITGHSIDIEFNPEFVRPNEIEELYGDPAFLTSIIGELPTIPLESTLTAMLQSYH